MNKNKILSKERQSTPMDAFNLLNKILKSD